MTQKDVCEIKSVRADIIKEVSAKIDDEELNKDISDLFKILGDYNRIRIICALKHQELCVCELSLLLDMSQSSISHQLRHLRNNNLVKYRKENKKIFYSLFDEDICKTIKEGKAYVKK